ncbi:MAG: hypothetical protein ACLRI8_03385 [Agathobacter rectalis]
MASCKTFEELPENAQKYISFIEKYIEYLLSSSEQVLKEKL